MKQYVIIKDLKSYDVNFEQNFCVSGNIPAITSILGLVHSIFRNIDGVKECRVCPIYHESERFVLNEKHIPPIKKIRQNNMASLYESMIGNIVFTLIIEIDMDDTYNVNNILTDIYNELYSKTLAGGSLWLPYGIKEISKFMTYSIDREQLLKDMGETVRAGRIVADKTELLDKHECTDKIEALIDILEIKRDEDGVFYKAYEGYLIPIAIGYAGLEEPQERKGRNGINLHSYVEPLTGVGEVLLFSKKRIQKILDHKIFWSYNSNTSNNTYLCIGNYF